jgi:ribonucleoside-diphosphate reductase subunit M1
VFDGSPYSEGKLQFDLWQEEYILRWGRDGKNNSVWRYDDNLPMEPSKWRQPRVDLVNKYGEVIDTVKPIWSEVSRVIKLYGLRNSLLGALMPTASTSKVLGNTESCDACYANIYSAKVLVGSYPVMNPCMVRDLQAIGFWNDRVRDYIISNDGSIKDIGQYYKINSSHFQATLTEQQLQRLAHLETKYKIIWEVSQKEMLKRTARRGKYIDQSQSTSVCVSDPTEEVLTAVHLLGDSLGLKTGMYYLRTRSTTGINKFTISLESNAKALEGAKNNTLVQCIDDVCISCQ